MKKDEKSGICRIVNGIYDDCCMETGVLIPDDKLDIICDWLESYATALEKAWAAKGSEGDARQQKFAKVRSFKAAVDRIRKGEGTSGT